jgi:hypothetical protein
MPQWLYTGISLCIFQQCILCDIATLDTIPGEPIARHWQLHSRLSELKPLLPMLRVDYAIAQVQ